MNHRPPARPTVALLVVRIAAFALSLQPTLSGAEPPALPPSQNQGTITYVSGGIGGPEAAAMKAEAARYPLAITFAEHLRDHDAFLADVPVVIRNASGMNVLDVVAEGPYLLVDLAPGRYEISASHRGHQKTERVHLVANGHRSLSFVWRGNDTAEPKDRPEAAAQPAHLPARTILNGVPYLTGGIGSTETQAVKAEFARHSLALTFAHRGSTRREYLASVPVVIRDAAGVSVLEVVTEGPFLLVDLPAGHYEVTATHGGETQRIKVRVEAGQHQERALLWSDTSPTTPQ